MGMEIGRPGLKTLYLIQILTERTDEEHALNAAQLGEILECEYGIHVNRQTIYSEIEKLEQADIDVVKLDGKLGGYYIASRRFELPELKLMVDAVQSSRFITEKKTRELIGKLESLCSREEAKQLSSQVVLYNRPKTMNETIYYNVDMLHSAIYKNLRIGFQYVEWTPQKKLNLRHGGEFYEVSPLHLTWEDENYYLIGFDEKAGKIKHYRVDKIRSMRILETKRSPEAVAETTDMASFAKKTFGMYGGEDADVRLLCKNHLAGVVIDRFGSDIWMFQKDEESFTAQVTVTVSPQFFGWVTAIGPDLQIAGPKEIREQYRTYLERLLEQSRIWENAD